jgi:pimeloyl-ACP methyl ester carboxylesterase
MRRVEASFRRQVGPLPAETQRLLLLGAADPVGDPILLWRAAAEAWYSASPFATYACIDTWLTDFRGDLPKIDVPVLVIHGTDDRLLPFDATAARLPALIADCTLVPVEGGPHNIAWTHPDEVNSALLEFIAAKPTVAA